MRWSHLCQPVGGIGIKAATVDDEYGQPDIDGGNRAVEQVSGLAAAAAVVVVAGAAAYIAYDRRPARTAPRAPVAATDLRTPAGDNVGQAVIFVQPEPYMAISVDLPASLYDRVSGPYLVTVVGRGGADLSQAQMGVLDGRGALNEPLGAVGDVVGVRVAAPNGMDLCSGPFGPGAGKGGHPPGLPPPGAGRSQSP